MSAIGINLYLMLAIHVYPLRLIIRFFETDFRSTSMLRQLPLFFAFYMLCINSIQAQTIIKHDFELEWAIDGQLTFDHADQYSVNPNLPVYTYMLPLDDAGSFSIEINPIITERISILHDALTEVKTAEFMYGANVHKEHGFWIAEIWVLPIAETSPGIYERILKGELIIKTKSLGTGGEGRSGPDFKEESVLASGIIHRVSVKKSGVYKIDYNFINDQLKINPSQISPDRIAIFGNGEGRLPQWSATPRIDDLEQSASLGSGLEDGKFDQGDYLLWYADGPHQWVYDAEDRLYHMELNNYDEANHYYIIINGPPRIKIADQSNQSGGDYTSTTSHVYERLEDEKVNLLGRYRPPGSGQAWYGDEMSVVKELDYTNRFNIQDLDPTDTLYYDVRVAVRNGALSRFFLQFDGYEAGRNVGSANLGNFEASYANDGLLTGFFVPGESIKKIAVRYPNANGVDARAWVDYLQLNFYKNNLYRPGQLLHIRDTRASASHTPIYALNGVPAGSQIWDVTNPFSPAKQHYEFGATSTFVRSGSVEYPNHFICFNAATDLQTPVYEGVIANQNLHSIDRADLLIVYYDDFEEAALKLANHRRSYSHLQVEAVPISKIFEEFAGGSKDPTAIRDFARMLYKRDAEFKSLCLIGDGTYDYLNHYSELPYQNFIPAFETEQSLDPIRSFPSDDYYALLDDDEGNNLIGAMEIGVGRIPVSTPDEALKVIDKVIYYDLEKSTLNDWRNRIVMVADDEDGNTHLRQADGLAILKENENPELNIQKIYFDAFPQESTPGGDRYPAVNDQIDLHMNKGALTITYMGHGGPNGWSQERVLGINQAQSYSNKNNMPLFITATCSFASYDEPGFTSTGEHLLLNPIGGAIALMTTVRAVYSGLNERLTRAVMERLYEPDQDGTYPSIGEVLRRAKNNGNDTLDVNARKFTLLGDPSQKLAIPEYQINVTAINGQPVLAGLPDTISALEKASVSGQVVDMHGNLLTSFNGPIYLTLFDKKQVRKTLANDSGSSVRPFETQNRQLFKGTASVQGGEWTIEFVLPKDIDFSFGHGKMSMYAQNGTTDATGYFTDFIIGGVSKDGLADDMPPEVKLFMNDDHFVFGGITDANPSIYIQLSDDNGINASGTSIGHDIEAILDGEDKNSLVLNDFYQASLNDYTRGEVLYPLSNMAPGLHTLKVTAWDLANNPGEAYLEFMVIDRNGPIIEKLMNYPNPFMSDTYFQFEHNRPGSQMDIDLNIFDLSGRFVKNIIIEDYVSNGYRVADLEWDGTNQENAEIPSGMYIYRLTVTFIQDGVREVAQTCAEKLVLIR